MHSVGRHRQNRVTPYGEILARPERGVLMGNRGDLHAPDGSYGGMASARRSWISCTLSHGTGSKVSFDRPGRYYPLFFLDEAVAITAGHRPCGKCRAKKLDEFKAAWKQAFGVSSEKFVSVREIDESLRRPSADRIARGNFGDLPDGAFVEVEGQGACLCWAGCLYPWCWEGYGEAVYRSQTNRFKLLTPFRMLAVLANGYRPALHPSLGLRATRCTV